MPKLLQLRQPLSTRVPEVKVQGVKLLLLGVREVTDTVKSLAGSASARTFQPSLNRRAVRHSASRNPFKSASPQPRKSLMRFMSVIDIVEGDYAPRPSALSPVREMNESHTSDCPMTIEELAESLPPARSKCESLEIASLKGIRVDATQSLPTLVPWEERYKVAVGLLEDYSGKLESLQEMLDAKDRELLAARQKLREEEREKATKAALRKIEELDEQLRLLDSERASRQQVKPPSDPCPNWQSFPSRRQVGFRYKHSESALKQHSAASLHLA